MLGIVRRAVRGGGGWRHLRRRLGRGGGVGGQRWGNRRVVEEKSKGSKESAHRPCLVLLGAWRHWRGVMPIRTSACLPLNVSEPDSSLHPSQLILPSCHPSRVTCHLHSPSIQRLHSAPVRPGPSRVNPAFTKRDEHEAGAKPENKLQMCEQTTDKHMLAPKISSASHMYRISVPIKFCEYLTADLFRLSLDALFDLRGI